MDKFFSILNWSYVNIGYIQPFENPDNVLSHRSPWQPFREFGSSSFGVDLMYIGSKSTPNGEEPKKEISVIQEYADLLPLIFAVPDQIKQVLLHSICLAMQSMPARSPEIQNTGIGIKPENKSRIFEPFYTTKPEVKGTGLGLPVVYGIVKYHHGTAHVTSVPGEGSRFTIHLPIKEREATPSGD